MVEATTAQKIIAAVFAAIIIILLIVAIIMIETHSHEKDKETDTESNGNTDETTAVTKAINETSTSLNPKRKLSKY